MSSFSAAIGAVIYDYTGARVLVTGGTSGIGAATAHAYAKAGAHVTITGTRGSSKDYDADLSGYDYRQLDVTDNAQIDALAESLNVVDVIVHSGGVGLASLGLDEYEPDNFELAVRMHLTSVYRLTHGCLDKLSSSKLAGGGCVIGIASMTTYFGNEVVPGYGAAKGALAQMMKTMAVAWSKRNVRANAVAAGMIKTRQTKAAVESAEYAAGFLARTPMKRFGEPSEIADAILFLTSAGATYLTGQTISVCGGFSVQG
ncbi:SDR family oxidoreductase [Paraburkholderia phymatum]|uniref:SDR family NAD(P)-dependent oxidoreductase n=1 Tax=Paraburkholderia phymatum TaxID=148447 RepID=UPI00317F2F05